MSSSSPATAVPSPQQPAAAFPRLCTHKESFLAPSLFDDYISKLHLDQRNVDMMENVE